MTCKTSSFDHEIAPCSISGLVLELLALDDQSLPVSYVKTPASHAREKTSTSQAS
jgi:hypothetical protein